MPDISTSKQNNFFINVSEKPQAGRVARWFDRWTICRTSEKFVPQKKLCGFEAQIYFIDIKCIKSVDKNSKKDEKINENTVELLYNECLGNEMTGITTEPFCPGSIVSWESALPLKQSDPHNELFQKPQAFRYKSIRLYKIAHCSKSVKYHFEAHRSLLAAVAVASSYKGAQFRTPLRIFITTSTQVEQLIKEAAASKVTIFGERETP